MVRSVSDCVISLCVVTSLAVCGEVRAEVAGGSSAIFEQSGHSIVGSFLRGNDPDLAALEGSFAMTAPDLSVPPMMQGDLGIPGTIPVIALLPPLPDPRDRAPLEMARLKIQDSPGTRGTVAPATQSSARPGKTQLATDPLAVTRTALPLLVGDIPSAVGGMRPMAGAVVGVRPAYVRPGLVQ